MLYLVANGPMPTTAAQAPVTTGTAVKTMLQIKPFVICKIVEWFISFDGSVAATPIRCELLETGLVFATVTAHVDAGCPKYDTVADAPVASVAGLTMGTAATGYTSTAEGTITATRMFDPQFVAPTNQYGKQFPLGSRPLVSLASALRIRVTAAAAVNCYCHVLLEI